MSAIEEAAKALSLARISEIEKRAEARIREAEEAAQSRIRDVEVSAIQRSSSTGRSSTEEEDGLVIDDLKLENKALKMEQNMLIK